jgi:hypothetical protein
MTQRLALIALIGFTACATSLSIGERPSSSASVEGVPINNLVPYGVASITLSGPFDNKEKPDVSIDLVDPDKILTVDICREPFASGTLKLQLTDRQTLKVLELESTPGTVAASKAAAKVASGASDIHKASIDAKKAKKDADKKEHDGGEASGDGK